ncbi:MAG: branched-chain amino acid ABC transporter permease [Burkholderiaceae bacterium]|jgi:branched-chain amino acid transport system permease protein
MSEPKVLPSLSEANGSKTARRYLGIALAPCMLVGLLLALPWIWSNPSQQNLFILALMAAQLGVAWNIVGGYAGQVSLGHAAFYGVGAYSSTLLYLRYGVNPWLGMLLAGAIAALVSLPIGWSCFRLRGHYFAMATIAVAEIMQILFTNWDFAGGAVGLTLPMDREGIATMVFSGKLPYYYLALALLALTIGVNWGIERSFIGYYFRAIKDDPDAARSVGVPVARYKQLALVVSSFLTGMGGSLYAQKELYIDPASVLSTGLSIKMALCAILGGVGTLFGPVVGAAILTFIEHTTRSVFGGTGRGGDLVIYALLIVFIAVYYPQGVLGWVSAWRARRTRPRMGTARQ